LALLRSAAAGARPEVLVPLIVGDLPSLEALELAEVLFELGQGPEATEIVQAVIRAELGAPDGHADRAWVLPLARSTAARA
jgi:hypothetical protein